MRRRTAVALATGALAGLATAPAGAVTGSDPIVVVAGTGVAPNDAANPSGPDNVAATASVAFRPRAAVGDAAGNVIFVQRGQAGARLVTPGGVIRRLAGTYVSAVGPDDGVAVDTQVAGISGVAVDGSGTVHLSEEGAGRLRRVSPAGVISTRLSGLNGALGIAVDGAGNVFLAESGAARVLRVPPSGPPSVVAGTGASGFNGDGIPANAAQLQGPAGVAVDAAGNLFIADNGRVRRVDAATGLIATIAGDGTVGFTGDGGPGGAARVAATGVAVDRAGNVYVAEGATGHRIRRIDRATGVITTIAGNGTAGFAGNGGPAAGSLLSTPFGISVDASGSLLIGDEGSATVRRIVNVPPTVSFSAAPGSGLAPLAVAFDGGASSGVNDGIVSHAWDFGDGTGGSGATVAHTYGNPGVYTARLTVMDASGAEATTTRPVTVVAPALRLDAARFAATWKTSRLSGRLVVTGSADRATRFRVAVLRASGAGKALLTRTFAIPAAGPFTRRLPLSGSLVPGPHLVRVTDIGPGAALPAQAVRAVLGAPPEGVAAKAVISTALGGRARTSIRRGPGIMFADFRLAALPRKGRKLSVTWYWSGRAGAIDTRPKARTRRVSAFVRSRSGALRPGAYRAELRAGKTLVAVARTRIR